MPYFSVIIPVYNKERFLKNTLQSVLSQSFADFEVILIDDGSTDQSKAVIDEFNDARIQYFYQNNSGAAAARNFGITKAKANYITFLDADDYWYPDCLMHFKSMIERFAGEPVFASAVEVENEKNILPAQYSIAKSQTPQIVNFFEASLRESAICTSCAVFHKSVFERIGYFDTTLKNGEDTDLWIRIGLEFNLVFSHEIMARYVYDAQSLSRGSQHLAHKLNLKKFSEQEKQNPELKKFLDLNRFSLAIKSKIYGQKEMFHEYVREINAQNLSFKKKLLLKLPGLVLLFLVKVNVALAAVGWSKSVFK
jgi:glycosyltransferase involved in cell wall biosynthesis